MEEGRKLEFLLDAKNKLDSELLLGEENELGPLLEGEYFFVCFEYFIPIAQNVVKCSQFWVILL